MDRERLDFDFSCVEDSSFLNQRNVLIAEDEFYNFYYLSELIKRMGATVIRAENGQEAVTFVQRNTDIDLVLMDLKMPVMNGYEATIEIKKLRADLPVIAVTAHAFPADRKKAMEVGCDDYVSKPINDLVLKCALYKCLKK